MLAIVRNNGDRKILKLEVGSGGGGGGLTNAYAAITDGANTANAVGSDTIKYRSANNILSVLVSNDEAIHGDNVLLTINQANIQLAQSQVTNLITALAALTPLTRNITINGVTQNLSADRTWTIADTNFANTNLALTANRQHNGAGYFLEINNTSWTALVAGDWSSGTEWGAFYADNGISQIEAVDSSDTARISTYNVNQSGGSGIYLYTTTGKVHVNTLPNLVDGSDRMLVWNQTTGIVGWRNVPTGGSGDVTGAVNLGGGLDNFHDKNGTNLRFNTFAASDFDLTSNVIYIDAAIKSDIANGVTAYSWGNHATVGYLTSQTDDIRNQFASPQTANYYISGNGYLSALYATSWVDISKAIGIGQALVINDTGTGGSPAGGYIKFGGAASSSFVPDVLFRPTPTAGWQHSYFRTITDDPSSYAYPAMMFDSAAAAGQLVNQDIFGVSSYNDMKLVVKASGQIRMNYYGAGNFVGTVAKYAAWTATGLMIEVDPSSIGGGGAHLHGIADENGSNQFSFGVNDDILFEGNGATVVTFDPAQKMIQFTSSLNLSDYSNDVGFITGNELITLTGDVTGSGTTSIATTIGARKVLTSMMPEVLDNRLWGRSAGTNGDVMEIVVGTGLSLAGGTLSATTQATETLTQTLTAGNLMTSAQSIDQKDVSNVTIGSWYNDGGAGRIDLSDGGTGSITIHGDGEITASIYVSAPTFFVQTGTGQSALTSLATVARAQALPDAAGTLVMSVNGNFADSAGNVTITAGGSGTVTSFAFTNGNGFSGSVTNATTTPTLSLISTVTDTQVIYSAAGALAGSANHTWNNTTNTHAITGNQTIVKSASGQAGGVTSQFSFTTHNFTGVTASTGAVFAAGFNIFTANINNTQTFSDSATYSGNVNIGRIGSTAGAGTYNVTVTQTGGVHRRAYSGNAVYPQLDSLPAGVTVTVDHYAGMQVLAPQATNGSGVSSALLANITSYYGLLLAASDEYANAGSKITNRFGIYQAGVNDVNMFYGQVRVNGNATNAGIRFGGVTATPSSTSAGDLWYRSDNGSFVVNAGGTAREIILSSAAQGMTNKTLTLAAGTTTQAPLTFTSGTNLTTAAAGSMEFDGKVFYNTPMGTVRALSPSVNFFVAQATIGLSNSNTAQNVFGASGVFNVQAGTTYTFEAYYSLTTGTTTHTTATLFAGTATITNIMYDAVIYSGAANALVTSVTQTNTTVATAKVLNATSNAAGTWIYLRGTVRINAGGTFIPQIQFSANPTGTNQTNVNSFFIMYPFGLGTVQSLL
jgi:hypothetical protein